jgi:valyl-tRNA synthetase
VEVSLSAGLAHVALDLSGAIDVVAERKRLQKDLAAAQKELKQTEAKLGNEGFLAKAPADVVDKIRARRDVAATDIDRITARLDALPVA